MQMQRAPGGNRRGRKGSGQGPDNHLGQGSQEVKLKDLKPLPPASLTFRPNRKGTGKAHLIPMVDGIDIPHVKSITLQQVTAEDAFLVLTVRLPHGVIIE